MTEQSWPDEITAVREATYRRRQAESDLRERIAAQRHAIRLARQAGHTTTDIAPHADLSRQRVNLATKG